MLIHIQCAVHLYLNSSHTYLTVQFFPCECKFLYGFPIAFLPTTATFPLHLLFAIIIRYIEHFHFMVSYYRWEEFPSVPHSFLSQCSLIGKADEPSRSGIICDSAFLLYPLSTGPKGETFFFANQLGIFSGGTV